MTQDVQGIGEKVELTLVSPDGRVKQRSSYPPPTPSARFCPACGEKLLEVGLQACTTCGKRYVTRTQIVDGKLITILVDLGAE